MTPWQRDDFISRMNEYNRKQKEESERKQGNKVVIPHEVVSGMPKVPPQKRR